MTSRSLLIQAGDGKSFLSAANITLAEIPTAIGQLSAVDALVIAIRLSGLPRFALLLVPTAVTVVVSVVSTVLAG